VCGPRGAGKRGTFDFSSEERIFFPTPARGNMEGMHRDSVKNPFDGLPRQICRGSDLEGYSKPKVASERL